MLVAKCLRQLSNSSSKSIKRSLTTAAAAASSPSSPTVSNSNLLFTSQFELNSTTTQRVEVKFLNNQLKLKLFPTKSTPLLPACSKSLPYIWLRTNCMCPSCYNRAAEECEIDLAKTDLISSQPIEITELTNNALSKSIRVIWSDGHKSEFELNELARLITGLQQQQSQQSFKTLWNHEILERCQGVTRLSYSDYMNDDLILRQALSQVYKYGAVIINQVYLWSWSKIK